MGDVYVQVGDMAYSKDTTKVPVKYAVNSQALMKEATTASLRGAKGLTPDKVVDPKTKAEPKGFIVNFTLVAVNFVKVQGMDGVQCKLDGTVSSYPENKLITQSLTGSATISGVGDNDVRDCIKIATTNAMVKSVIPTLQKMPAP